MEHFFAAISAKLFFYVVDLNIKYQFVKLRAIKDKYPN